MYVVSFIVFGWPAHIDLCLLYGLRVCGSRQYKSHFSTIVKIAIRMKHFPSKHNMLGCDKVRSYFLNFFFTFHNIRKFFIKNKKFQWTAHR